MIFQLFAASLITLILTPTSAFAAEPLSREQLRAMDRILGMARDSSSFDRPCPGSEPMDEKPTCSSLAQQACNRLWQKEDAGNADFLTATIRAGKSPKPGLSQIQFMDLQALLDSEPRLPEDLRKQAQPVFARLRAELSRKSSEKAAKRAIEDIQTEWRRALDDVTDARAEAETARAKSEWEGLNPVDRKARINEIGEKLKSEVLDAKYARHPNWKRVQRIFEVAKQDMVAEIQTMNLPAALKSEMLTRVSSVRLSLPYTDPKILNAEPDCGTTVENAYYDPQYNLFTVCAGYFNGYQADSNLYATIVHEVGHSVGPDVLADSRFRNTELAHAAEKLSMSQGPSMSCTDWKSLLSKTTKLDRRGAAPLVIQPSIYGELTECLAPADDLPRLSVNELKESAQATVADMAHQYSTEEAFTDLSEPMYRDAGKRKPNDFYLRPDRWIAKSGNGSFRTQPDPEEALLGAFTQSLSCQTIEISGRVLKYKELPEELRDRAVSRAIEEAKEFQTGIIARRLAGCGKDCEALADSGLGRYVDEQFADWMAIRTLPRLLNREPNLARRREMAALAGVDLCGEPGPAFDAHRVAVAVKKFSHEPHPEKHVRRVSVFSQKVADAVSCEIDLDVRRGYGRCE